MNCMGGEMDDIKQYILDNLLKKNGSLYSSCDKIQTWKKLSLDLTIYNKIYNSWEEYPNAKTSIQLLYDIVYNIKEIQYCEVCKNEPKRFVNFIKGYRTCCSSKCSKNHPHFNESRRKTTLEKYGVEHVTQLDSEKERRTTTCLEKYGYTHHTKSKNVQEKRKVTTIKRYGVDHVSQLDDIKTKKSETCLINYGVSNPSKSKEIQKTKSDNCIKRHGVPHHTKTQHYRDSVCKEFPLLKDKEWLEEQHKTKSTTEIATILGTTAAKVLYWINVHEIEHKHFNIKSQQKQIQEYLTSIGIEYIVNDRDTLKPKELDIHIIDKNIAIEVNGVYWHQEEKVGKYYHINKLNLCESNDIRLIQLWDFEWDYKSEICKSVINTTLNKNDVIYARSTVVTEIKTSDARTFLDDNHLQGFCKSKIKLGLYYNGEIVSVMTFGKPRFNKKYQWELIRFCNKLNTNVVGGASKMFRYFIKNYAPDNIISYSDKRLFSGKLYENLKFTYLHDSEPNYFYVKNRKTLSRYECQKHKLKDVLGENFDETMTEEENMINNDWYVVYDCGNSVWEYRSK